MTKQYFLEAIVYEDGKRKFVNVPVSEEVYKSYMRPEWRQAKRIQRSYERLSEVSGVSDVEPKIKHDKQEVYTASAKMGNFTGEVLGLPLSLDRANEEGGFVVIDNQDVEEEVLQSIAYELLWNEFYKTLATLKDRDAKVMKAWLVEQLTEREIATLVGISQKTVNNIKKRHLPLFQEALKEFTQE